MARKSASEPKSDTKAKAAGKKSTSVPMKEKVKKTKKSAAAEPVQSKARVVSGATADDELKKPCLNGFGLPELQPKRKAGAKLVPAPLTLVKKGNAWEKKELTVSFLQTSHPIPDIFEEIEKIAKEWEKGTSLKLKFFKGLVPNADIRVDLNQSGTYCSIVGRHSAHASGGQWSMILGFRPGSVDYQKRRYYILHEFGHALGLEHEFKKPVAGNKLNVAAAIDHFRSNGLGHLSPENLKEQFVAVMQTDIDPRSTLDFDDNSIMMYDLPAHVWPPGGLTAPSELSAKDREGMSKLFGSDLPRTGPVGLQLIPNAKVKSAYYLFGNDTALFHFRAPAAGEYQIKVTGEIAEGVVDPYAHVPLKVDIINPLLALRTQFEVLGEHPTIKNAPAESPLPVKGAEFRVQRGQGFEPIGETKINLEAGKTYFVRASISPNPNGEPHPNQVARFVIQIIKSP